MKEKNISIIMGIYNCEKYLQNSIESILKQTYSDWELIMCDDGSTDSTYRIAKKYADKYENIILLKNDKNMGLNYTLNKCIECSKGKYIARQDADDISLPTRLKKQYDFLENHTEYAMVGTKVVRFDDDGIWGECKVIEKPKAKDLLINTPFVHASIMIRKETMEKVNYYTVDKKLLRVEDYHLWFKIYSIGQEGCNLNEVLYEVRDDEDAYKRRNLRNRINEVRVRWIGNKLLKRPFWDYIYVIRPILVWMLPRFIYKKLHSKNLIEKV